MLGSGKLYLWYLNKFQIKDSGNKDMFHMQPKLVTICPNYLSIEIQLQLAV